MQRRCGRWWSNGGRLPLPPGRAEPWRIAVLVRNRNHLAEIVSELKGGDGRAAIPYRAVDIEELGERQEVLDLFALTRALLHPADRVAWLAVLRAPWCGMGLADLHVLTGADDPTWRERSLWVAVKERGEFLSADGVARLERLWPVMEAAEQQRGRLSTAAVGGTDMANAGRRRLPDGGGDGECAAISAVARCDGRGVWT